MGKIYVEFAEELAEIARKYKNRPGKELDVLLHIALQREELVTTAYRATFLQRNIEKLPVSSEVKKIIRHALIWIWKDEDMHTIYTRGALLQSSVFLHRANVYLNQFNGFVGGWAGSTVQHLSWKESPFSVSLAKTILFFGKLSGKISREIQKELKFSSFRNFCGFNIDAEQTARICWEKILFLAKSDSRFTANHLRDFQKIIFDEQQHERIFQLLYDSLTDSDHLTDTATAEKLVSDIGAISPYFLPAEYRTKTDHSIGQPTTVVCSENHSQLDKYTFFSHELRKTELNELLRKTAALHAKTLQELTIVIKVAFSMGYSKSDLSPITDPILLEQLVQELRNAGIQHIQVIEVNSIYRQFFGNRSVEQLADYFGFTSKNYTIIDASQDVVSHDFSRGIGTYAVSAAWKNADFRINLAKLRSHPVEMALLSVHNLEWLTGDIQEFVFTNRIINRSTVNSMLLADFPAHYTIVEAYDQIPDGLIGVMGCKKPVAPKRFYFGKDPVSVDLVIMQHLGSTPPEKGSLKNAMHWFGMEQLQANVEGEQSAIRDWKSPTRNLFWAFLSFSSASVYQLFSRKGLLFVPQMDVAAFPHLKRPGLWVRFMRFINRKITNLPN